MSLEFSRRSFMKLTALTAVAVAGSSLLSGCDSSSSTLYPSGAFGKELTLMGKFTVSDPKYDADAKTLTCAFKGTCTSDTPLAIRSKFFQVDVLRDKKTTSYNAESVGCTLALSQSNYYLTKKKLDRDHHDPDRHRSAEWRRGLGDVLPAVGVLFQRQRAGLHRSARHLEGHLQRWFLHLIFPIFAFLPSGLRRAAFCIPVLGQISNFWRTFSAILCLVYKRGFLLQ